MRAETNRITLDAYSPPGGQSRNMFICLAWFPSLCAMLLFPKNTGSLRLESTVCYGIWILAQVGRSYNC